VDDPSLAAGDLCVRWDTPRTIIHADIRILPMDDFPSLRIDVHCILVHYTDLGPIVTTGYPRHSAGQETTLTVSDDAVIH
jgi:hypothetical protein